MIGDYKEHTHCTCFVADRRTNHVKDSIDTFDHDWWGEAGVLASAPFKEFRSVLVFLYTPTTNQRAARHHPSQSACAATNSTTSWTNTTTRVTSTPEGRGRWRSMTAEEDSCASRLCGNAVKDTPTQLVATLENTYDLLKFISKKLLWIFIRCMVVLFYLKRFFRHKIS